MRAILLQRQITLSFLHRPKQVIQHLLTYGCLSHTYCLALRVSEITAGCGLYIVCDGHVSAISGLDSEQDGSGPVVSLRPVPSRTARLSLIGETLCPTTALT